MKKQDEIANLINGSRKQTHNFISQINDALLERASFSEIAHALSWTLAIFRHLKVRFSRDF